MSKKRTPLTVCFNAGNFELLKDGNVVCRLDENTIQNLIKENEKLISENLILQKRLDEST
jgi:hypothetical protein